jgi:hypothetical protein
LKYPLASKVQHTPFGFTTSNLFIKLLMLERISFLNQVDSTLIAQAGSIAGHAIAPCHGFQAIKLCIFGLAHLARRDWSAGLGKRPQAPQKMNGGLS